MVEQQTLNLVVQGSSPWSPIILKPWNKLLVSVSGFLIFGHCAIALFQFDSFDAWLMITTQELLDRSLILHSVSRLFWPIITIGKIISRISRLSIWESNQEDSRPIELLVFSACETAEEDNRAVWVFCKRNGITLPNLFIGVNFTSNVFYVSLWQTLSKKTLQKLCQKFTENLQKLCGNFVNNSWFLNLRLGYVYIIISAT